MNEALFQSVSQYVFGGLFLFLFLYVLDQNKKREGWLQSHLDNAQKINEQTANMLQLMKSEIINELDNIKDALSRK